MSRTNRQGTGGRNAPGRLRIIAGCWRGRRVPVASAPGLRPTGDRVRETLFNWLAPVIAGSRCLDLFAGSGALGLEALSRGARGCVFVERSPGVAKHLRRVLELLECDRARVIEADALTWLATAAHQPFDIVFLDPPFGEGLATAAWNRLQTPGILAPGARVYLELPGTEAPPPLPRGWSLYREGRSGAVCFRLYDTGSGALSGPVAIA